MSNDKLNQSVPWREALELRRWYLTMRIGDYNRLCAACPNREALLEQRRQKVKSGYRMYGAPDEKSGDML